MLLQLSIATIVAAAGALLIKKYGVKNCLQDAEAAVAAVKAAQKDHEDAKVALALAHGAAAIALSAVNDAAAKAVADVAALTPPVA